MPTLHLPFDQSPRLFESARSTASDLGPTGQSLLSLPFPRDSGILPELPPVCLVTGERENVTFRRVRFSWFPSWVLLLSLLPTGSVALAGIAAWLLTKKAVGHLPFTDRGWRQ
ncbi:MAG TPA: hypothetical protein VND93_30180, partial [Myxococcales bacterium]|nr:hypothetical protein [Myxococcales bacterium]